MNIKDAIEYLEESKCNQKQGKVHQERHNEALDVTIKALEKQAFFENQVSDIHNWFVDNRDCLLDDAMKVADSRFNEISIENIEGEFTNVDLHFIVEDIVDKIQEGILNVLDSYKRG